jgi:hypothetical protein
MHEPGADRPNEPLLLNFPIGKGNQDVPTLGNPRDTQIPRLAQGVRRVWKHPQRSSPKCIFNFLERHTVFATLLTVSVVPIETGDRLDHLTRLPNVCTNVHTYADQ